jgi:putative NIF3 family GTP cyclohydrolase 1 type 2
VGKKGVLETVDEVKLEMVCNKAKIGEIVQVRESKNKFGFLFSSIHQKIKRSFERTIPMKHQHLSSTIWCHFHKKELAKVQIITRFHFSLISLVLPSSFQTKTKGRIVVLEDKRKLSEIIKTVEQYLQLSHLRLAIPFTKSIEEITIGSIAICAGSGASVLKGVRADLYLTGEMGHHDVLAAIGNGTSVILTEHSNTERGYLHFFKKELHSKLDGKVEVLVSKVDRDPLFVVGPEK